ncbi:MAG: DUF4296 domain-containing protein [Bacteroidia bacterium]|jgi:hypothetical protein|nr:DUF4296 domain-containing protein [Bacteroidota bacterium]MCZ2130505.1 DUF4296 domain-containing protein [Bacteroidia bacterium]
MTLGFNYDRSYKLQRVFILLLIILIASCSRPQSNQPKNLIADQTMSQIVAELKIIDAAYQSGVAPKGAEESQKSVRIDTADGPKQKTSVLESLKEIVTTKEGQEAISYEPTESKPVTSVKRVYKGNVGADYEFVFNKHKVTRQQFEQSLDYYSKNPDLFQPILEKALEILTRYEIQVTKD